MEQKENAKFHKNAKKVVAVLVILLVAMVGTTVYVYSGYKEAAQIVVDKPVNNDTIYEGIRILGVDVGGLTREEAKIALQSITDIDANQIQLSYENHNWNYTYEDLGVVYDIDKAVQDAYNYLRDENENDRAELLRALKNDPLEIQVDYTLDESRLDEILADISTTIDIEPIDATITRANGAFVASGGRVGLKVNTEQTKTNIVSYINSQDIDRQLLVVEEAEPKASEAVFAQITDVLGTFSTSFSGADSGRATNIRVGAENINGWILLPGEVFSTNEALGPQTYDNGYRYAGVIINGKMDTGIGGGVCQLSTTLYNAVLFSELEVVERRNHSLTIGYVPIGRDAAVAGDYLDFKFRNSSEHPIYIEYLVDGGTLTATIYGHETRPSNRTIDFTQSSQYTGTPQPKIIDDPTLPLGEEVVVTASKSGITAQSYKRIYIDGVLTETVKVDDSSYRSTVGEIRRGTGEPAEEIPDTDPDAVDENQIPVTDPVTDVDTPANTPDPVIDEPVIDVPDNNVEEAPAPDEVYEPEQTIPPMEEEE